MSLHEIMQKAPAALTADERDELRHGIRDYFEPKPPEVSETARELEDLRYQVLVSRPLGSWSQDDLSFVRRRTVEVLRAMGY